LGKREEVYSRRNPNGPPSKPPNSAEKQRPHEIMQKTPSRKKGEKREIAGRRFLDALGKGRDSPGRPQGESGKSRRSVWDKTEAEGRRSVLIGRGCYPCPIYGRNKEAKNDKEGLLLSGEERLIKKGQKKFIQKGKKRRGGNNRTQTAPFSP